MRHGDMRSRGAAAAFGALILMAFGWSAHADHRGGGYYVSVEIPIEEHVYPDGASLRLDRLVDRRTGFDSDHFHLRELVLIARSTGAAHAELRMHGEASEAIDIPEGNEDEWWEVRIPAPTDRHGGVWRLYLTGDVALDQVVAVMEPRERYAARYQSPKQVASRYTRPYRSPSYYTYYPPSRYHDVTVHHVHHRFPHPRYGHWSYRTWYPHYASPWVRRHDPLVFHYYTVLPGWRHDYGVHRHVLGGHRHHGHRQRPLRRHDLHLATRSGRPAPLSQATGREPAPLDASLRTFSRGPDSRAPARRRQAGEPRVQPQRMAAAKDRLESQARRMTTPASSRTSTATQKHRDVVARGPSAESPHAQVRQSRATTPKATAPRQQPRRAAMNRSASPSAAPSPRSRLTERRSAATQTRSSRRTETWHGTPRNRAMPTTRTERGADRLRSVRQQPSMRRQSIPQRQAAPRQTRPQMRSFERRTQSHRSAPTMSAPRRSAPPAVSSQGRLRATNQGLHEARR